MNFKQIVTRLRNVFTGETEKWAEGLRDANRTMASSLLEMTHDLHESNKMRDKYKADYARQEYNRLKSGPVWLKPGEVVVSAEVFQDFCDDRRMSRGDAMRELDIRQKVK